MIYADVYNNVYLLSIKHYWFDCSLRYVFVCFKFRFILMLACIMGRETQICERHGQKRFVLAAKTGFCWRARHPPATLSQ
jgi:hypothetical protein